MNPKQAQHELGVQILKEVEHYWDVVREGADHLEYLRSFKWVLSCLDEAEGGCLEFKQPLDKDGYGIVHVHGQKWRVHRLVWTHYKGDVTGLDVHHTCHNRRCANLEHLMAFTHAEHMAQHKLEREQAKQSTTVGKGVQKRVKRPVKPKRKTSRDVVNVTIHTSVECKAPRISG